MNNKTLELFQTLKQDFQTKIQETGSKPNYTVILKLSSDPRFTLTLNVPSEKEIIYHQKVIICYNDNHKTKSHFNKIKGEQVYFCDSWTELQQLTDYIAFHSDLFSFTNTDILDDRQNTMFIKNIDEFLENNYEDLDEENKSSLYNN